jgi:hypothetical protein
MSENQLSIDTGFHVAIHRFRTQASGRQPVSYRLPAVLELADALELVRVLLDSDTPVSGPGPWERPITFGRQVIELIAAH